MKCELVFNLEVGKGHVERVDEERALLQRQSSHPVVLGLLSLVVALVVAWWIARSRQQPTWQGLALACLLGGTVGNGIDRWSAGYVTDFLELVPIDFPIFNGADVAINLAVACFVIDALSSPNPPSQR